MKILNYIVRIIFICLMAVSMLGITVLFTMTNTILNQNYILKILEKNNFYENTYSLVCNNFEKYIEQSGFDKETIRNIYTQEDVKNDINKIIENIYLGKNNIIDSQKISEKIQINNKNASEIDKIMMSKFIDCIEEEYYSTILHTNYEKSINDVIVKINSYLKIAKIMSGIFLGICFVILILINLKDKVKILQNFLISLMSSSLIFFTAYFAFINNVNISQIYIFNITFSNAIYVILKDILSKMLFINSIEFILSFVLIFIMFRIYLNKTMKNNTKLED